MMTALLIGLVVLGGSAGDVFITKGMKQVGEISTLNVGRFAAAIAAIGSSIARLAAAIHVLLSMFDLH